MRLLNFDLSEKMDFIHAALGGGICFFVMFLLSDLAQVALERLLIFFGVVGVVVFEQQFLLARLVIMFGVVYLTSGFCGGLYTGYNVKENLKIIFAIPGIIGFIGLTILTYFLGYVDLSTIDFTSEIFLPLLGSMLGAYLGGYTMNWPSEGEETSEEIEKLTVDLRK